MSGFDTYAELLLLDAGVDAPSREDVAAMRRLLGRACEVRRRAMLAGRIVRWRSVLSAADVEAGDRFHGGRVPCAGRMRCSALVIDLVTFGGVYNRCRRQRVVGSPYCWVHHRMAQARTVRSYHDRLWARTRGRNFDRLWAQKRVRGSPR